MRVRTMSKSEGAACHISEYPNFSVTGSIKGMKKLYYGKDALLVRCGRYDLRDVRCVKKNKPVKAK